MSKLQDALAATEAHVDSVKQRGAAAVAQAKEMAEVELDTAQASYARVGSRSRQTNAELEAVAVKLEEGSAADQSVISEQDKAVTAASSKHDAAVAVAQKAAMREVPAPCWYLHRETDSLFDIAKYECMECMCERC